MIKYVSLKSQASYMPDISDSPGCIQSGESQTEEKRRSTFLYLQEMSFLPTILCMLQRWGYRPALGRGSSLSSADRFWQAWVTSPGDCQPSSPAPGMTGTQPQALVGQSARERPLTNLCRHPSVSPQDALTVDTHHNVVSLQRNTSLESTSALYLAGAGLPDH